MLSKSKIRYIRSLELKKFRDARRVFVAEGNKLVADMLGAFPCEWLLAKPAWMATQGDIPAAELRTDEGEDIRKVSFLATPQDVIAVFRRPTCDIGEVDASACLTLALDGVQDPGNLGSVIRLADWFGIGHVVCSPDTADVFSPKDVQATMGALAHVKVHYTPLEPWLRAASAASIPLYGAFLQGENLYTQPLSRTGIIVMGNEGNGIRPETEALIDRRLYIPPWPSGRSVPDSLNVAVAAAIVCAEFRRRG
jgi:TrmH family RNA methyltransferase